jgi:ribosomal protein S27AE
MPDTKRKISEKRCPKCGGSLFIDSDVYGWYEHCIHCGLTRDLPVLFRNGEKNLSIP